MDLLVQCPLCGYTMSVFDESVVRVNRSMRRAYEHALKNPVLCAECGRWVLRPRVERNQRVEECVPRE